MSNTHRHGGTGTRLFEIWLGMKARCYNKNNKDYPRYGGRGIAICHEWRDDFASFRRWALRNGYRDDLTIDRKDNNKSYTPTNCRWITNKEQQRNKSDNRTVTIGNETHTVVEWSEISGVNADCIYQRLSKQGWDGERAVFTPPRGGGRA